MGPRALLLAASLALAATPGCIIFGLIESLVPAGSTETKEYVKLKKEDLWERIKEIVAKHFRIRDVDEDAFYLNTEWDVVLGVHYQTGFRRQLHLWVKEGSKGPYLQLQCLREKNVNIQATLDPYAAEWESDGRDERQEIRIELELDLKLGLMKESPTAGKPKTSPYLTKESESERDRRLWGDPKGN
ncbi:MAG: hypothetical protein L0216_08180 [Planctomycetales bacterium]|nr:hypothetical protein [Planctomycetales bacterium]